MSGGEVISQKESEYWSKMYRYELSQNLQWKIGSPYLLSLGYQIYTLPFNDSEPLAPCSRRQDHCFPSWGFTWQLGRTVMIAQTKEWVLITPASGTEEEIWETA